MSVTIDTLTRGKTVGDFPEIQYKREFVSVANEC